MICEFVRSVPCENSGYRYLALRIEPGLFGRQMWPVISSIFLAMCMRNKRKSVYLPVLGIQRAPKAVSLGHHSTVAPWGVNLLSVKA